MPAAVIPIGLSYFRDPPHSRSGGRCITRSQLMDAISGLALIVSHIIHGTAAPTEAVKKTLPVL